MEIISLATDEYAADYSVAKLLPEAEERLRQALAFGQDFEASWECRRASTIGGVVHHQGHLFTDVEQAFDGLDEDNDVIAEIWERAMPDGPLPDDVALQDLHDQAVDAGLQECAFAREQLEDGAGLHDIIAVLERLEKQVREQNEDQYLQLERIVQAEAAAAKA